MSLPTLEPAHRSSLYRPAPLRATRNLQFRALLSFASAPMLLGAFGFALGILDSHWVWHPPLLFLIAAFLAAAITLVALRWAERILWLPLLLLWMMAGQFAAITTPQPTTSPLLLHLADRLQRNVTGTVIAIHSSRTEAETPLFQPEQQTEQTEQINVAVDHIEDFSAEKDWQAPVHGGLRLTIYARAPQQLPQIRCGERIQTALRLHQPDRYLDPGAWDYPAYLAQHGIAVLGSANGDAVQVLPERGHTSLNCLATAAQTWAATRLDKVTTIALSLPAWLHFTSQDSALLGAMLFGDRTRLRHSLRTAFERTGSFHLLVVSGLHVTLIIGFLFWLSRRLGLSPGIATVLSLLLALPYAFLTGFAPPVQRALWLSAVYLVCRILYRERTALNAIGIAALGVLLLRPAALFDSSFQMTFLAVLAIAGVAAPLLETTVLPYLRGLRLPRQIALDPHLPPRIAQMRVSLRMLSESLRPFLGARWAWRLPFGMVRWSLRLAEAILIALVVELAMVLPMAVYFHRVTMMALPANLLGLPLLALLLPLALLTFLLSCVHPLLAVPTGCLTALLLHFISWLIHGFGALSLAGLRISNPHPWTVLFFLAAWAAALWLMRSPGRQYLGLGWKRISALAFIILAAILVLWPFPPVLHKGVLEVTAIDVGQGDSLLVITPDGHTLLVDAGGPVGGERESDASFDVGEDVVSQYLWWRGFRRLDAVALTHAHSDHMGGMPAVLQNFRPATLWVGNNPEIPEYRALLDLAQEEKISVKPLHAGEQFSFGGTMVQVLAPAAGYQAGLRASNNDSLVMRISYLQTAVLLEGDAEAPVEQEMVATEPLSAELLKVGHHGSSTSTTPPFLAAVHPEYAVISAGRNNPFGHPRVPVLNALAMAHVRVYRTDTLGLSSFLLNGKTVQPLR